MRSAAAAVAPTVALLLFLAVPPASGQDSPAGRAGAADTAPPPDADWRVVMEQAIEASRASAYQGRLVIVALGDRGPTVTEVDVAQGTGGGMRVGRAEAWMVGRSQEDGFYFRREAGNLLRFGNIERIRFDLQELTTKYEVRRAGVRELRFGPSIVLAIRERGAEHDRERLFVDQDSGLVVRRETFAAGGAPRRVVAFTELEIAELSVEPPTGLPAERSDGEVVTGAELESLRQLGWAVPDELPAGFGLRGGYALPESAGSSLHLVYSDGLYTLSVYEQFGRLDGNAVDGAAGHSAEGRHVWRRPGSEPERLVWSGDGLTFTAISDAPVDAVMPAISGLPGERPPTWDRRLGRGLQRVGGWLWPFD